jgi:SAM-dependent methyltransferase
MGKYLANNRDRRVLSTQKIYRAVIRAAESRLSDTQPSPITHLDVGAGRGELIREIAKRLQCTSQACDYHVERFEIKDVPIATVNLNSLPLPYSDGQFTLVTCSEVIEHLENYRHLLREACRILNPGGVFVVTTPNVLNMYSRVRYLVSGFANLFGPLPLRNDKLYSTGGHITPITYFYLAHGLADAGFVDIELSVDKTQKTSVFWLTCLFPFVLLGWWWFMNRERRKFKTVTAENEQHVANHLSWAVLVGRTIVVSAVRPSG